MWVWRDETVRGGWRLDGTGSWSYEEPARLARVGAARDPRHDELRAREEFAREQRARQERMQPAMAALPGDPFEPEPIFRSVAHETRTGRGERHYDGERYRHAFRQGPARIPEPHPGSGPFPAQQDEARYDRYDEVRYDEPRYDEPRYDPRHDEARYDRSRYDEPRHRGLAPVAAVPAPPAPGYEAAVSPEEELRRRAERRRRPRVEPESGRHTLRR